MRIALLTNIISPHQLPLAKRLAERVGPGNYTYVYTEPMHEERKRMGWEDEVPKWAVHADENHPALLEADIVYCGHRALQLFQRRIAAGKLTFYVSERWFKPPWGFLRVLSPRYLQMARAFRSLFASPFFHYLPQGIHAARDMARLMLLLDGRLSALFSAPAVAFEPRPGGSILPIEAASALSALPSESLQWARRNGFLRLPDQPRPLPSPAGIFDKMHLWGYFVEDSANPRPPSPAPAPLPRNVLWAGRMLDWKRVDTLVRACAALPDIHLNLYGHGPEEARLRRIASRHPNIVFHDNVPIREMRALMRSHDLYVLPSDATEGWGAVVSEALAEHLPVLATAESGAGATMLEPDCLFHADDDELRRRLCQPVPVTPAACWSADYAAEAFVKLAASLAHPVSR